jgi:predicted TIM-barrel fold metal-dependent hydrolase
MSYFDSLVHATSDGRWLNANRYDASFQRLVRELDLAKVERACLVGIAGYIDNESVLGFANRCPDRLVPIAGFNPIRFELPLISHEIARLAALGFRGIKLHPRLNDYDPLDPRCMQAIRIAGEERLVVFLDTLFRQRTRSVLHPVDIIDRIIKECAHTRIVFLHSSGPTMLELFELGRMHDQILLDLSFSILRYAGSSLDLDMRFLCEQLDLRVTVGSDFPEYTPAEMLRRFDELTCGLNPNKRRNILFDNLQRVFT